LWTRLVRNRVKNFLASVSNQGGSTLILGRQGHNYPQVSNTENYGPRPPTARSQVDSVPSGVPIYSQVFDPSLARRHDGGSMLTKLFAPF